MTSNPSAAERRSRPFNSAWNVLLSVNTSRLATAATTTSETHCALADRVPAGLVEAYRQAEVDTATGAGLFTLSSIPTDRAEPSEALKATVAWHTGLDEPRVLLSTDQLDGFLRPGRQQVHLLVLFVLVPDQHQPEQGDQQDEHRRDADLQRDAAHCVGAFGQG